MTTHDKATWWPVKPWTEMTPRERKTILAIPCPCGLQYTRDLSGGGRAIIVPPAEWMTRIVQRAPVRIHIRTDTIENIHANIEANQ